jgi:antirestriction protein ArdC
MNPNDKPPPRDHRQELTDEIVSLLAANKAPWQQPWESGPASGMPFNPTTGREYRGGNILSLMIASMVRGYTDPRFCTYLQAQEEGWQVRKGAKGVRIEFWEPKAGSDDSDAADDDRKSRLIHRVYTVFNASQIDGLPPLDVVPKKTFEIIEAAEKVIRASGAEIRHGGGKAFYRPSDDYVQMPERQYFVDEPHYYATLLHELAHWTGAKHRLNRLADAKFGTPDYAKEEIRADLTSLFLPAELGIPYDPKDQAAYIKNWIQVLKNDKNEVFKAAADASKACDFLLQRQQEKPLSHVERLASQTAAQSQSR